MSDGPADRCGRQPAEPISRGALHDLGEGCGEGDRPDRIGKQEHGGQQGSDEGSVDAALTCGRRVDGPPSGTG